MLAAIEKATTDLATDLVAAAKEATDCLTSRTGEAVEGAKYIEEELDACLAGTV